MKLTRLHKYLLLLWSQFLSAMESTTEVSILGLNVCASLTELAHILRLLVLPILLFSVHTCLRDICEKYLKTLLNEIDKTAQIIVDTLVSIFISNGVDSRGMHVWSLTELSPIMPIFHCFIDTCFAGSCRYFFEILL
jgi:hypothetical protein